MAQRVRDILLRIRGDASDAQHDLHEIARDLKQFDGLTAEATVDINTAAADRKIATAKQKVQDFGRLSESAKVDLQETAARTKLAQLNQQLENLRRKEASPKVDIAIGATVAKIERVEAQLDRLDRRRVDIDVDVDRHGRLGGIARAVTGGISGAGRGFGLLITGLTAATEAFGGFIAVVSRGFGVVGGLANLFVQAGVTGLALVGTFAQMGVAGIALGVVFAGLSVIIGGALIQAVVLLGGAMFALAASFATAAAGVGVLAVALAGAFGPVLLVAIAAIARFAAILKAVKQNQDDVAESAEKVKTANDAQAQAQQNAVRAAQQVRVTAVEAYRAWRDAAEETSDAIRGIAQAELSRDQARLNVKQAEQALRDLRKETGLTDESFDSLFNKFTDVDFRPENLIKAIQQSPLGKAEGVDPLEVEQAILNVRQARLDEKDAIDGVSDAHTRLNDARSKENQFIQNGISAYAPYTAAVQANKEAQKALADATKDVADAQQQQNDAFKDLSPIERRVAAAFIGLKNAFEDLVSPATEAIFEGLIDFFKDLQGLARDSGIRRGIRHIGDAIGDAFRSFGRLLRRREVRDALADLAESGAHVIRQFGRVFRSVFTILLRIAQAATPWLKDVAKDIGDFFVNLARTATRSRIRRIIRDIRDAFDAWWDLAKELWGTLKALFGGAHKSGTDFIRDVLTPIVRRFRRKLEADPDALKNFFNDATGFAEDLLDTLDRIATALEKMVGWVETLKDAFKDAKDAWGDVPEPVREGIKRGVKRGLPWPYSLLGQSGGVIPGTGAGDHIPLLAEPGEFLLRRSVAQAIGVPRLNALNAGNLAAVSAGGGITIHQQDVHLPAAPGHDQMGDARHQAAVFARELRRRGRSGLGGGGLI